MTIKTLCSIWGLSSLQVSKITVNTHHTRLCFDIFGHYNYFFEEDLINYLHS